MKSTSKTAAPRCRAWTLARWWFRQALGRRAPLVSTMYLRRPDPDRPRHSNPLANVALSDGIEAMGFEEARRLLRDHRDRGALAARFELGADGWLPEKDGLFAIMGEARRLGFLKVGYCADGDRPLVSGSDEIMVRVEGPPNIHDALHGEGAFETLGRKLEKAPSQSRVIAHITVSLLNIRVFEEAVSAAAELPAVDTVTFDFATHRQCDDVLGPTQRAIVASLALQLKKRKQPIGVPNCVLKRLARLEPALACPAWMSLHALPDASQKTGCPAGPSDGCRHCDSIEGAERAMLAEGDVRLLFEKAWNVLRRGLRRSRQKDARARKNAKEGPAAL